MANRITVTLHRKKYAILAEENEEYIRQCADMVDRELGNIMAGTTLSLEDGAVLAALNLADMLCKEKEVSDSLRAQLKSALDENMRMARGETARKPRKSAKAEKPEQPAAEE